MESDDFTLEFKLPPRLHPRPPVIGIYKSQNWKACVETDSKPERIRSSHVWKMKMSHLFRKSVFSNMSLFSILI